MLKIYMKKNIAYKSIKCRSYDYRHYKKNIRGLGAMVFNATFKNISVISWRSV